jgi:hypothetical protein
MGNIAGASAFPFLAINRFVNSSIIFSNGSLSRILLALENVERLRLIP